MSNFLKSLGKVPLIDCDPNPDKEETPGVVRQPVFLKNVLNSTNVPGQKPGKKKGKGELITTMRNNDDETTMDYIIKNKPPKKKVIAFIKHRISELEAEDDE
jgi:hypothetical protein